MTQATDRLPTLLHDLAALEAEVAASAEGPRFIFKHSLTCPISAMALGEYHRFAAELATPAAHLSLIEIQNSRPLSGQLAEITGIRHESPQAILLFGGKAVWHASHGAITAPALHRALAAL